MKENKIIIGMGNGAEQFHYTRKPFWDVKIKKEDKFLLRECPDCGKSKLRKNQRYCDSCTKKRRQKTNREYQRKYYRKHRV